MRTYQSKVNLRMVSLIGDDWVDQLRVSFRDFVQSHKTQNKIALDLHFNNSCEMTGEQSIAVDSWVADYMSEIEPRSIHQFIVSIPEYQHLVERFVDDQDPFRTIVSSPYHVMSGWGINEMTGHDTVFCIAERIDKNGQEAEQSGHRGVPERRPSQEGVGSGI